MSQATIPAETIERIVAASAADADLVAEDRADRERRLFFAHCRRVWERLDPTDRAVIEETVEWDDPALKRGSCIRVVQQIVEEKRAYA